MASKVAGKKVYVTRIVPQPGIDLLKSQGVELKIWESDEKIPHEELVKNLKAFQPDGLFCLLTDTINEEVLAAAGPQLKIVSTMSVGFEHIDREACKKRNIPTTHTPFVSTESVAELTLTLLLFVARRIREADNAVKAGQWGAWRPLWLVGPTLEEATVGIFGLGRIGFAIAERVLPFKPKRLLYYDVVKSPHADKVKAEYTMADDILKEADFVISMSPLTPETKHMFNAAAFKKMKKGSVFLNTSRGGVVNEKDLFDALKNGDIGYAGLDVTDPEPMSPQSPLLTLPNCVVLPHVGSSTMVARNKMSNMTAENIIAVLSGEAPKNPCQ